MPIFNDTKVAFADKSDAQLRKAYWMFKMIEQPALTKVGTSVLNFSVHKKLKFDMKIRHQFLNFKVF